MTSPVYWHPLFYQSVMRVLYGKHFEERYRALAELIPENVSVTEVCMGDAYLYRHYLKQKNIEYVGLDMNPVFVAGALRRDIDAHYHNVAADPIPSADYIIMQASLYQFMPEHKPIVKKLLDAATNTFILAEPVKNLAASSNPLLSCIGKYSANPGHKHAVNRFNRDSLLDFFHQFKEFKESKEIKGGRELIGIFKK